MFAKAVAISALLAVAQAGVAPAVVQYSSPSVGVSGSNTVRGVAGLSSVTHQAKAVDSAFSTVRKTDTRVTNDAQPIYAQQVQPVQYTQQVQAAPVQYAQQIQPVQYTQQVQAAPVQYAQQVQPAVQYTQQVQPAVQYAQQVQPAVQYAQQVQPAVQYAQQVQPAVYQQASIAAVSGPRPYYNYAPVAYAQPGVQYGTKTLSGVAPVGVAKVAAAPVQYAGAVQYHQPTFVQQAVTKVAAPVALAKTVPVAKTANLLGVNFSPIQPGVATSYFNGFGASYSLF
ncbi:Larval/pupal cuticle protein H1C [Orchesella cincta]|uniref:Larval/pupal cuticle protein H1C n=1 Tax=Orchesella cincta TaxID=48709 RepID=A0A1D2NMU7_ORCCI|nr:Larval/pupal cuticle protein H1C [Orchesella cincta]